VRVGRRAAAANYYYIIYNVFVCVRVISSARMYNNNVAVNNRPVVFVSSSTAAVSTWGECRVINVSVALVVEEPNSIELISRLSPVTHGESLHQIGLANRLVKAKYRPYYIYTIYTCVYAHTNCTLIRAPQSHEV